MRGCLCGTNIMQKVARATVTNAMLRISSSSVNMFEFLVLFMALVGYGIARRLVAIPVFTSAVRNAGVVKLSTAPSAIPMFPP